MYRHAGGSPILQPNYVIDEWIFVAIVVMALITSLIAGPMMNWFLSPRIAAMQIKKNAKLQQTEQSQ